MAASTSFNVIECPNSITFNKFLRTNSAFQHALILDLLLQFLAHEHV